MIFRGAELLDKTHLFVLQHMTEVNAYLEEHVTQIRQKNRSKNYLWIKIAYIHSLSEWFKERVMSTLISNQSKTG